MSLPDPVPSELDGSAMEGLRAVGGTDLVDEVIGLASEDVERSIVLLDAALAARDAPSAMTLSHTISGVRANIGATAVAHTAQALEYLAAGGDLDQGPALSNEMAAGWSRAHVALVALSERSQPA